ncbi:hypothetical protein AUK22_10665 [bacterium CG2_30_54_10]|nr:MAG: hypothetical protein AUK22_10665 [bacterium CG2_30_54_10]
MNSFPLQGQSILKDVQGKVKNYLWIIDTVATLQTDFLSNTVIASEAKQSSSYQEIASSLRSSQ